MRCHVFKKTLACLFFLLPICLSSATAQAFEFLPLGHVEILRAYSEIKKGSGNMGFDLSGYYSPIIKFDDTLYLIPLYSAQYQDIAQYLPEQEGNIFFNTYLVHNFNCVLRKEFKPGWFLKFGPLGTWNLVKEASGDKWGRGLYDYRDAGFVVEIKRQITQEDAVNIALAAFEYYRRQYPNFATLISSTTVTPPERREKDYDGYKGKLRIERAAAGGARWYAEGTLLNKAFLDKHLVADDGSLDLDEHRLDTEFSLDAGYARPLPWERFHFFVDGNGTAYHSNIGYYDSRNTLALTDDVFTPRYYAFNSASITPGLEYVHPLGEQKILRLRVTYGCLYRLYTKRKAQDASGAYFDKKEADTEQEYAITISVPITPKLNWVTKYAFLHVISTQKYEEYYRYNYDSYQIKSGISLEF